MGLQPLEPVQGILEGEELSWEGAEPGLWSDAGARQPGFKSSYLTSGNCLTHVLVFWPVNWGQEYNQPHRAVLQDQEVNTENQVSTGKSLYLGVASRQGLKDRGGGSLRKEPEATGPPAELKGLLRQGRV